MASLLPHSAREAFQQANTTVLKFFLTFIAFTFVGRIFSEFLSPESKLAKELVLKGFMLIGLFIAWKFVFY